MSGRIALIEPFGGVAGDMFVGALLHAGAPLKPIREGLARLGLEDYSVSQRKVMRCGVSAKKFRVKHQQGHHHRGLTAILKLIGKAKFADRVTRRAADTFKLLARAEAKVHGVKVEQVHFHEVGAIDAICDVVGACLALESLDIDTLHTRSLPLSTGSVVAAHGRIPLPAPATLELLRGWPVHDSGLAGELVTPTGAALVAALCDPGPPPAMIPTAIGYGAGDRDPEGYPNVCRIMVGEALETTRAADGQLWELVCDVDDATPQVLGHLLERLLESGALDATLHPVVMKKNRPATRVSALAPTEAIPAVERALFWEGTTLGVRRRRVERTALPRRVVTVETPYGRVPVKVGRIGGKVVHFAPEYEDCRRLAREAGVALREVVRAAMAEWRP